MGAGELAAVICGIGASLPQTVVPNAELCGRLDTTDEWIRTRTGIGQRHVAGPHVSTEDLAVQAATNAMACAPGVTVNAVLVATTTPDQVCPAAAPAVAARLGLTGIPALDMAAGCSGFLYGLATAAALLTSRAARSFSGDTDPAAIGAVLVIGAERLSILPDPGDRTTVPLFGDGAGAMLLRAGAPSDPGAVGPILLGSDGTHRDLIWADRPGALRLHGGQVFRQAVDQMTATATAAAHAAGWNLRSVDWLVAHQANARITGFAAQRLGMAEKRRLHNIACVGNTGAASIPLLLAHAAADGNLTAGNRLLLTAFGSGLTWAATTATWPDLSPCPVTPPRAAEGAP